MRDFKKLEVWQLGMEIADQVFEIFDTIPWQQAGNKIRDQATDAACSIPSNIAEGSSRRSEKEKYRYYEFALGSSFELQTRMLVIQRRKYADSEVIERLLQKIELEQKKIGAFMNALDAECAIGLWLPAGSSCSVLVSVVVCTTIGRSNEQLASSQKPRAKGAFALTSPPSRTRSYPRPTSSDNGRSWLSRSPPGPNSGSS